MNIPICICLAVLCFTGLYGCAILAGSSPAAEVSSVSATPISAVSNPSVSAATRTPIYAISGGKNQQISPSDCMDLDSGSLLGLEDTECDFAFSLPVGDGQGSVRFIPLSYASFDFKHVFWDLPDQQACSLLTEYSANPEWINATGGYYVCFQTGQGHWGILKVKGMSEDDLVVYWITYPEKTALIARQAAQYPVSSTPTKEDLPSKTPVPEKVFSRGNSMWVRLDEGLDLDTGGIRPVWNNEDDLVVSPGEMGANGLLLNLLLDPAGNAGIQSGEGFEIAPRRADCAKGIDFQTEPVIADKVHRYWCFQTSTGRFGYVYIHEINPGVGVRLDWVTWPAISGLLTKPSPVSTPLESGAAVKLVAAPQLGGVKVYRPGQVISFTWQLTNTGKTTWNTRHALVFTEGNAMGGLEKKWVPYPISPGMTVKLALSLTVPKVPGTYTAVYWLVDDAGHRFGIGENGSHPLQLVINAGEPGITAADGQGVSLAAGTCFDLDLGYPSVDNTTCDFSVDRSQDSNLLQFTSLQAAFDFDTLFSTPPRLGECKTARLSGGRHVLDLQDWYVCYKTADGRYGWLKIRDLTQDSLDFDWKTYQ